MNFANRQDIMSYLYTRATNHNSSEYFHFAYTNKSSNWKSCVATGNVATLLTAAQARGEMSTVTSTGSLELTVTTMWLRSLPPSPNSQATIPAGETCTVSPWG
jgi:hypothetical protein